jgi:hypothetical protein
VAGVNGSPSGWTAPAGWTPGANSGSTGQGLFWWWQQLPATPLASYTFTSTGYTDGGIVLIDLRGQTATPIQAVSARVENNNNWNGNITSAAVNGVTWTGSTKVASLILMSWQASNATAGWPAGFSLLSSANDGYSWVAVGANLTTQTVSSLAAQTVSLSTPQVAVPTLQVAIAAT